MSGGDGTEAGAAEETEAVTRAATEAVADAAAGPGPGPRAGAPVEVSCVVTAGTDPGALRRSVESVVAQTMRAVEAVLVIGLTGVAPAEAGTPDAESAADDVRALADELAALDPARVRVVTSGAETPTTAVLRNHGLDRAHGRYVIVLGEGERLQRDACRNLWEAAERTGADVVAGRWTRRAGRRAKEQTPARLAESGLYARSRTVDDPADAPELVVGDALVTGFCVRATLLERAGLRYAEDLDDGGDLLFGARLALTADRIALVPNLIVGGRAADDPAGTLEGQLAAHVRIADLPSLRDRPSVREARDRAFLADRLVPLARQFPKLDAGTRARAAALVAALPAARTRPGLRLDLPPLERVCLQLLLAGDADGVLAAGYALTRPGTVASPLAEHDGRIYWHAALPDDPGKRAALDVTDLGHQYRTLTDTPLFNHLTHCGQEGDRFVLEGRLPAPLELLPPETPLTATLEFLARGSDGRRVFRTPVDEVWRESGTVRWRAGVDIGALLRVGGARDRVCDPHLALHTPGGTTTGPLFLERDRAESAGHYRARPRRGRLFGDSWQPYVTVKHHLALQLVARRRPGRLAAAAVHYLTHFRPARNAKRLLRAVRRRFDRLSARPVKTRVYNRLLIRLPVRKGSVVFESHMGTCYGDSPRAIHEELRAQGRRKVRSTWSYATSTDGFPADARLVRRLSWRYLWALARAQYWVDNQGFPLELRKPPGTTYLQTWHGSAYKRMGFAESRIKAQNAAERDRLSAALARFDHFLVRSEHDVATLARDYRQPAESLVRCGYPRNDRLVRARATDESRGRFPRPAPAAELGIGDHRTVVLYAPTFRGTPKKGRATRLPLDVRRFADRFGDDHVLLVRAHYLESAVLPVCPPGTVIDVSGHHDVSELLCLADVLITDYSSIMFDYALLDRPMVFHTPDLDAYAAERGSYFDLRAEAPGPVVGTEDELHKAIAGLKVSDTEHRAARARFAEKFGGFESGLAARTALDVLLAGRPRR
ncbi:bifunctional glycosyltransferase family 2 protein/CDP-glycerol:glycerophosphate glycerophosphotransferase [Streptomyces sp. NBC_01498]|uniref:bifunctional glycosyltransferase/CDP-glycerol:glycerophosphate glycerophosphotransferase n=1 Tax=Streptomyces sp. NBC_01498 TaxID=2975870 RepID=UPI002E7B8CAF|nr:CDP-glycerol glycerophosphotransferase family protein [Streptomyces sp. NBC_01498]WTL26623.1 bifunctional glycosyltransferase family 2 protein/CDP-glycerol:glycerophosphate glycerophosphotransferase [Streptomyces sp. NBC_01498]